MNINASYHIDLAEWQCYRHISSPFTEKKARGKISWNMVKLLQQFRFRLVAVFICAAFLFCIFSFFLPTAHAENSTDENPADHLKVPCLIVVDQNDPSAVIYEKNADQRCIPGSTMKIMTCILSLELCTNLEETVTASAQAALLKDSNSLMGVIKNEPLTIRQLLYGLMLKSGNDAALLLAQTLGGSTEHFVELMNEKAASLGMKNTHFINPSGAYKRDQYSTARDMAILTCYALKNELFREIVSTVRYSIEPNGVRTRTLTMVNSNKLISDPADSRLFYEFATGVKTGSTAQGGKCLVASAIKNGSGVVAVLLGVTEGGSKLDRMSTVYEDAKSIMDLALTEQFVSVSPAELGLDADLSLPVSGTEQITAKLRPSFSQETVSLTRAQAEQIRSSPRLVCVKTSVSFLTAPIAEGDFCATAVYSLNGRDLFIADLVAKESIAAESAGLEISTVATPAPELETAPEQSCLPQWLIDTLIGVVVVAIGSAVFLVVRAKKANEKAILPFEEKN